MTDEVSCVALYDGRPEIQLTDASLAISLRGRGGIEAYRLRIDDQEPSGLKLAADIEKQVGAIIWESDDFHRIIQARRLRFQGLTVRSTLVEEDIDLAGLSLVIEALSGAPCR